MILFSTNYPKISNDLCDVIRLFFGAREIKLFKENEGIDGTDKIVLTHTHTIKNDIFVENYVLIENGNSKSYHYELKFDINSDEIMKKRTAKRAGKLGLYYLLKEHTQMILPWGSLTGIRPTSLYRQLNKFENNSAVEQFTNVLDVSRSKINLVEEIIANQEGIYYKGDEKAIDVYIGIPFCPSRCLYCSFISHDLSRRSAPLEEYTECVLKEIDALKGVLEKNNKQIRSIYFGGGTPTTLSTSQLERILNALNGISPDGIEITVEAGRVDTIDEDLLKMLKNNAVSRISINPQTFNDKTLEVVNRKHTVKEALYWLERANTIGFDSINMDLIMGLPSETKKDMEHSLRVASTLAIDNLTVHTLALKRASSIKMNNLQLSYASEKDVADMVDLARETACDIDMKPYYLYRQKYMSGNLENVGYAKKGKQCVYNIDIMEETHNLFAIGAGAISKRFFYDKNLHTRFSNPKSIEHYMKNIDKIIADKLEYYKDL